MPLRKHGTVVRKRAFSSRGPASAQQHFVLRRVRDDIRAQKRGVEKLLAKGLTPEPMRLGKVPSP
jgi:hypothetical protein